MKTLKISDLRKAAADKALADFADRFWANVKKTEFGCWEWQGNSIKGGYGQIALPGMRRGTTAHRASWLLHHGEVPLKEKGPQSLVVRHTCDNPRCVRIDHLVLGTQLDNIRDMFERGRAKALRGEETTMAKMTEQKVIDLRKRYVSGGITMRALAKEAGMSYGGMWQLLRGATWKHLSNETTH